MSLELDATVEQIVRERDEARAEVERLRSGAETPPSPFLSDHPPLTEEQADYIGRWIELYAIRPVGIPADGAPVELWEARIINTLRTWGTRRREQREAGVR